MNFLEMNGLQTAQTHFKDIFQNNIHRDYADAMLDWLEQETDFFTAPSSTKYHGAHPGGLLAHSLNVYYRLRNIAIRDLADKEDPGKCRLDRRTGGRAMKKELCKPCAIALENRGKTVKAAGGRCEKITCAECGRRRFGYTYEVTGWPTHRKKEDKLT